MAMTIRDLIQKKINSNKYVIPAIQRKYVWREKNICKLMDSIMREYPIGYIMLWNVTGDYINSKEITFYKFLDDCSENKDEYNKPIGSVAPGDDYYAVLDGQQRIQSMIIALNGKYISKSGVKKELYINLLADDTRDVDAEDDDSYQSYTEFKFFDEKGLERNKNGVWFKVKDILNIDDSRAIRNALEIYKDRLGDEYDRATDILKTLMNRINERDNILKIEEISSKFKDINEVLEIFIRANSSGEQLTKSDLLFSTVVLNWDKGRDTIDDFLKKINDKTSALPFKFTTDFIMKTFLFIQGDDMSMRIEHFDKIAKGIEEAWPKISNAIEKVVRYLRTMRFSHVIINSYNSIIPLVYYTYKGGSFTFKDMEEIKKYLVIAQLKSIFGSSGDQVLKTCKDVIRDKKTFKVKDFYGAVFANGSTFKVNENDIDRWLNYEKDTWEASLVLRLLYADEEYKLGGFQKDHVHPKQLIEELNNKEFNKYCNKVPNLEILSGHINDKKQTTPLKEWAKDHKVLYLKKDMSLELKDFLSFIEIRGELMKKELKKIFKVK